MIYHYTAMIDPYKIPNIHHLLNNYCIEFMNRLIIDPFDFTIPIFFYLLYSNYHLKYIIHLKYMIHHKFYSKWIITPRSSRPPRLPAELQALAKDCDQLRRRSLTGKLTSEAGHLGRFFRKNRRNRVIFGGFMVV